MLRPGDVLYLPRGFLHSATALGEISAHLTIGIHPVTRWGAAESALDLVRTLAAADPDLRGSLPLGVDLGDPASVRDDVAAVIAGLQDWLGRLDPAEVADRLRAQTWAQVRPEPVAPLAQSAAAAALTADTVLRLRRRLRCSLRDDDDGRRHPAGRPALALLPRRGPRGTAGAALRRRAQGRRPARPRPGRPVDAGPAADHRVDRHRARRGAARRADPGAGHDGTRGDASGNER